jgi:hypothetical protein
MAKVSPLQSNFSGGEFSPLLYGRVDTERYATGLALCQNYIPTVQGGLIRRSGTYFISEVKDSTKAVRLIPFEFSTTQAYILEFGDLYIRFYRNHAQIESGGSPVEVASPYLEADLDGIRYVQSADVLYLVHPDYAPRTLSRISHTSWTLSTLTFLDGPYLPTNDTATTITPSGTSGTVTLTASAALFASTDVGRVIRVLQLIRNWTISTAYAVGDVVKNDGGKVYTCTEAGTSAGAGGPTGTGAAITDGTVIWEFTSYNVYQWGWARITVYTSTTVVSAAVGASHFGSTVASDEWRLGVYSATTGYPSNVVFYEDRLFFSGAANAPQRVDGSETGDYTSFAPTAADGTVTDASAVSFTFNATMVNKVQWMAPDERGLMIGTTGGEWVVRPSSLGEALSATNVTAKRSTAYGSADVQVVSAGKAALYVQRSGRKLRELRYFLQEDGFESPDITMLAEHITAGGIRALAHQKEPQSIIWTLLANGGLVGVTYERDMDALRVGWHRHLFGGTSDAGGSAPIVGSIAAIPSPDGTRDELWLVVQRYVNGAAVQHIEYLTPFFEDTVPQEEAFFVDCGLSYAGVATTTVTGLDHLEGETVAVLADGAVHPAAVVTGGSITLGYAAEAIHVGYAYESKGKMLRLETGAQDGTALGKVRRVHRLGVLLHRTLGLEIGMDFDAMDTVVFRTFDDPDGAAPALFSGVLSQNIEANYDMDNYICWRQSQPLPGTILAVMPQLVTQDRG